MTPEELDLEFPLGPDSKPQEGVPAGRTEKFTHAGSEIFPGTVRDVWIYVPAQYDPAVPACVMVVQDGQDHMRPERRWRIPTILDNLIHQRAIPVTIGIFINPGVIPARIEGGAPRANRSFEYDSRGDRYARFLLEEILPEVARRYNLRPDSNSRAIMGGSSGAFCAFNVAWERPDAFQRVLSIVGSYTALRGGHTMPESVRLTEAKPLRVFLESGADDLVVFAGNWWTGNLNMLAALEYAGYEVDHSWAEHAGHNDYHGSAIFPAALKWLWRDYPKPIRAGADSRQAVARVVSEGGPWELVAGAHASAVTAAPDGRVYFASAEDGGLHCIDVDGRASKLADGIEAVTGLAVGPEGRVFLCQPNQRRVAVLEPNGKLKPWLERTDAHQLSCATNGNGYLADGVNRCVWLATPNGERRVVASDLGERPVVQVSADQSKLIVGDAGQAVAWMFTIQPGGDLAHGAPLFQLNQGAGNAPVGTRGLASSGRDWNLFATDIGLQLADSSGLIAGIISLPSGVRPTGLALGGAERDRLYVSDGLRLFRRKIKNAESLWG